MREFKNLILTVNPIVNFLFVVSTLFIFAYKFIFLNVPEIFPGASNLGDISYNVSLAFVASYVFYIIVVHLKEFRDEKVVSQIMRNKLEGIINIRNTIATHFKVNPKGVSEKMMKTTLMGINPKLNAPSAFYLNLSNPNPTWIDFLNYYLGETTNIIEDTYHLMPYLDPALLKIPYKIERANFISHLKPFVGYRTYTYPDLSPFARSFCDYSAFVDELQLYMDENERQYK